jgi:hypothetical protein
LQVEDASAKKLLRSHGFSKIEVLYREKDGSLIAHIAGKQDRFVKNVLDPIAKSSGVYCLDNFEVYNGKLKVIYLGKRDRFGEIPQEAGEF